MDLQEHWTPRTPRTKRMPKLLIQQAPAKLRNWKVTHGGNPGFLFLKPHANVKEGRSCVRDRLEQQGIAIIGEGCLDAEEIDRRGIIDAHYRSLASKALHLRPHELVVREEAQACFESVFGLPWREALQSGLVCNAKEALERLGFNVEQLDAKWSPLKLGVGKVKFGGGFYCGKIEDIFVINGFYMAMRARYTRPGRSIHWYALEWKAADMSWENFRSLLVGATHPEDAVDGSLRGHFRDHWARLGLDAPLDTGDNAVHASAGAFEALVERSNWLGMDFQDDPFGRELLHRVPVSTLHHWAQDPIIVHEGRPSSLFDLFENLDGKESLELATDLLESSGDSRAG